MCRAERKKKKRAFAEWLRVVNALASHRVLFTNLAARVPLFFLSNRRGIRRRAPRYGNYAARVPGYTRRIHNSFVTIDDSESRICTFPIRENLLDLPYPPSLSLSLAPICPMPPSFSLAAPSVSVFRSLAPRSPFFFLSSHSLTCQSSRSCRIDRRTASCRRARRGCPRPS